MILLLQAVCAVLMLQLFFAVWNASRLPKLAELGGDHGMDTGEDACPGREAGNKVRLSVLIPARNEAAHIAACLESLLACRGAERGCEILVLDDGSSDGTGNLASLAGGSRVKVLTGRELPAGWLGKSFACAQLAEAASGEWLLFLDADVRLRKEALVTALAAAYAQGNGLITGFPRQNTGTWLERLVVPLMTFTIICHLPIPLVRSSSDPRFTAAHGGFMLIHRNTYAACGGHEAIRAELVDDMALARSVKSSGAKVTLADITPYAGMRMYHNASEVWRGYRKNIYAGLGRRPMLLAIILAFYFFLYVFPLPVLAAGILTGNEAMASWALSALLLGAGIKRTADAAGRQPWLFCLLLPAAMISLSAIAAASWYGSRPGRGYEWKGRRYE